jgi:hypothetical protein
MKFGYPPLLLLLFTARKKFLKQRKYGLGSAGAPASQHKKENLRHLLPGKQSQIANESSFQPKPDFPTIRNFVCYPRNLEDYPLFLNCPISELPVAINPLKTFNVDSNSLPGPILPPGATFSA